MSHSESNLKKAFGPLWEIYNQDNVHEIIVDAPDDVYYEQGGKHLDRDDLFKDSDEIYEVIKELAKLAGRKITKETTAIDFTLDEYTRVMAVLPPLSVKGPAFNLLKIPKQQVGWNELVKWKAITEEGRTIVEDIIKNNKSVLVAGGVGSGKTTLTNVVLNTIPDPYRVVILEKVPMLITQRKRCVRLQAPHHKSEEMLDLVKASGKMRGDYIVLAELEGPETMSFLELLRDGYDGIAAISAENIFDAIRRLEFKAMGSAIGVSLDDIRYSISQAFDYVIYQERLETGERKVTSIAKIAYDEGQVKLEVVYRNE